MVEVFLPVTLFVTVAKSLLVIDAVILPAGRGFVARTAETICSKTPLGTPKSAACPLQQPQGPTGTAASKARSLHLKLLAMHAAAIIGQGAAVLKYALPVSVVNCRVTHQVMLAFMLLFDASLVTFFLAKVEVTNGSRTLARWEKVVIWLSRAYAWVYLPVGAVALSSTFPGGTNEGGTFCYNDFSKVSSYDDSNNVLGYASNSAALIVQFAILLVLFVKPMLVQQGGTQSGGAMYKRVIIRNLACTALVCIFNLITTVVVIFALLKESPEDNTASRVADVVPTVNQLITLCLIEISLPLGFTSCMKACVAGNATKNQSRGRGAAAVTATTAKVVPLAELPPQEA